MNTHFHEAGHELTGMLHSPPWMAPEQIFGRPITVAVDVFAFGAILWELLTAKMPFAHRINTPDVERLQLVCQSERGLTPPSDSDLSGLDPRLRASLRRLIVAAHHPNPVLRPGLRLRANMSH